MALADRGELQALLAWTSLPSVGDRSLVALIDHAREGRSSLRALWEAPLDDLTAIVRLHPKAVAALEREAAEYWARAGDDAGAVRAAGVELLLAGEPDASPGLAACGRRWPYLFAYGSLSLLEEPRIALLSSRGATNTGLAATDALADALARRDVPLVASTNRESYQAAAVAAKRQAAAAVMVLDRGMAAVFPTGVDREPIAPARVWDTQVDPDLQLFLSPFPWRLPWHPRSGPQRDALIVELADVVVAVDVRTGGNMERECRAAAARGKPVVALDRGPDTPAGTRHLWEAAAGVRRLAWSGADRAAEELLSLLPERPATAGVERSQEGWWRELAPFLARACSLLPGPRDRSRVSVGAFPGSGPLARTAAAWGARGEQTAAGHDWLLADLLAGGHSAARPGQLLERVARGGLLAAVVPAAWLEGTAQRAARAKWLERAALRLVARLPLPVDAHGAEPAAAVILERDASPHVAARVFTPQTERMGRFHLRRYLQEILADLHAGPAAG
jgi:predicted Rossmann fold nucleotide-binding protein DprA/Smf involved in DNA uptake